MNSQRCSCRRVSIPNGISAIVHLLKAMPQRRAPTTALSMPPVSGPQISRGLPSSSDARCSARSRAATSGFSDTRKSRAGPPRESITAATDRGRSASSTLLSQCGIATVTSRPSCDNHVTIAVKWRRPPGSVRISSAFGVISTGSATEAIKPTPRTRRNSILSQLPKVRKHSPIDTSAPRQTSGRPCD